MINMYQIKKERILINSFSNLSEYYNYLKNTPRRKGADDSSESNDRHFTGTDSLDEAYNLMLYGDEELFSEIASKKNKIDITKILGNKINRNTNFNDIVGFQADVPAFLKGVPTNMINQHPKKISQKVLNIFIDGACSCGMSKEKIQECGVIYASVIDMLEKIGYRCNVYMTEFSTYNNYKYGSLVRIKTDREPFNLKKLAFPIAHTSFFRRLGFKWIESCDLDVRAIGSDPTQHGYGRPLDDNKEKKKILEQYLKIKAIVLSKQNSGKVSVESVIKELEREGIKIGD